MESYLELVIIVLMQGHDFRWDTWGCWFNNIWLPFFVVALGVMPFLILYMRYNFDKLLEPEWADRFDVTTSELDLREDRNVLLWPFFFMVRRMLYALLLVFLTGYPVFQIAGMVMMTVFMVIFMGHVRPFATKFQHYNELYNECTVMILTYHLICFSNLNTDADSAYIMGFSMVFFTLQNVLINLGMLIGFALRDVIRARRAKFLKIKMESNRQRHRKRMKEARLKKLLRINESVAEMMPHYREVDLMKKAIAQQKLIMAAA